MRRCVPRDDQWENIEHQLLRKASDVGVAARDNRLLVKAHSLSLPGKNSMTGFAGAVWRFPCHSHTAHAVEPQGCSESCFQCVVERCRRRIYYDEGIEFCMVGTSASSFAIRLNHTVGHATSAGFSRAKRHFQIVTPSQES